MTSKREAVLSGVKALLTTAMPYGDVVRNRDKPSRISPAGTAILRDGDPGEPEYAMSPLSYTWTHRIPVDLAVDDSDPSTREARLDAILTAIGALITADRTLGGLCDFLDAEPPSPDDAEDLGQDPIRWTDLILLATYTTTSPLT